MTERYLFLSADWIVKATELRAEVEERFGDRIPEPPAEVQINVRVTDIPHRSDLDGHIDSTGGTLTILEGHLPVADLAITTDYLTAAELFTATGPEEFMQSIMPAILGGRIMVEGDLNRLLPLMQRRVGGTDSIPPEAREIGARIIGFTEV